MGLLSKGQSLTWDETKTYADHIRDNGIEQLINIYHRLKNRSNDALKWGDEVEYQLVYFDNVNKDVRLALVGKEVLEILNIAENFDPDFVDSLWRVEYASYMIEGTPGKPFCCSLCRLRFIETSMYLRRMEVKRVLEKFPGVKLFNLAVFPRLGCPEFTQPKIIIKDLDKNNITRSLWYPDDAITSVHPRFRNLSRNIRERRGKRQTILVPIFRDKNTPNPFYETIPEYDDGEASIATKEGHILFDCMGFGMGCCCLQVTLQARNIDEAKLLYDQLATIAPILLSTSAASPIWKGYLADIDCRWKVISGSVDDRNLYEMEIMDDGKSRIPKSRYSSIDMYISPENSILNDTRVEYSQKYYERLLSEGMDSQLAKHFAHLFIRDPISAFKEKLDQDNMAESDHFENIQSTNWQSIRFKPPPPDTPIGWRVEFRSLETQLTDFENAAYVKFVMLLTRLITTKRINTMIPISLMEENMRRAISRNSVLEQRFYFRKNINEMSNDNIDIEEMTVNQIINGYENFIGLIPLLRNYIDETKLHIQTRWHVNSAFDVISKKADGTYMTAATWMRDFVLNHPLYKHDSYVSKEISYDLLKEIDEITNGRKGSQKLFGSHTQKTIDQSYIDEYREMLACQSHFLINNSSDSLQELKVSDIMLNISSYCTQMSIDSNDINLDKSNCKTNQSSFVTSDSECQSIQELASNNIIYNGETNSNSIIVGTKNEIEIVPHEDNDVQPQSNY